MTKVIYTGTSDFQTFDANDFKKANVEDQEKVTFAKDEPTEVSDSAAKALTSEEGIFGLHQFKLEDKTPETSETPEGVEDNSGDDSNEERPPADPEYSQAADDSELETPSLEVEGEMATTEGTANSDADTTGTSTPVKGTSKRTGRGTSTRGTA